MSEALIDAVARAIYETDQPDFAARWGTKRTPDQLQIERGYRTAARAAIAAIEASGTHVVAPAVATDAMIAAARGNNYEWPANCYDVMIDARPKVVTP